MKVHARDFDYSLLPNSVRELADTIGINATYQLIETWGGCDFYVPRRVTRKLAEMIGIEAAQALVDNYYSGSDRLQLPRCVSAMRAVLHKRIVKAHYEGVTASELARKYHYSERYIFRILSDHRDDQATPLDQVKRASKA